MIQQYIPTICVYVVFDFSMGNSKDKKFWIPSTSIDTKS